jgi:hypothetical protein
MLQCLFWGAQSIFVLISFAHLRRKTFAMAGLP